MAIATNGGMVFEVQTPQVVQIRHQCEHREWPVLTLTDITLKQAWRVVREFIPRTGRQSGGSPARPFVRADYFLTGGFCGIISSSALTSFFSFSMSFFAASICSWMSAQQSGSFPADSPFLM